MENARKTLLSGPSHHICWHNLEFIYMAWKMQLYIYIFLGCCLNLHSQAVNGSSIGPGCLWGVQLPPSLRDLCVIALQLELSARAAVGDAHCLGALRSSTNHPPK